MAGERGAGIHRGGQMFQPESSRLTYQYRIVIWVRGRERAEPYIVDPMTEPEMRRVEDALMIPEPGWVKLTMGSGSFVNVRREHVSAYEVERTTRQAD